MCDHAWRPLDHRFHEISTQRTFTTQTTTVSGWHKPSGPFGGKSKSYSETKHEFTNIVLTTDTPTKIYAIDCECVHCGIKFELRLSELRSILGADQHDDVEALIPASVNYRVDNRVVAYSAQRCMPGDHNFKSDGSHYMIRTTNDFGSDRIQGLKAETHRCDKCGTITSPLLVVPLDKGLITSPFDLQRLTM